MKPTNEKVPFRLINMPCCNILLCWVNPRRPMYCSECGTRIFNCFPRDRWENTYSEAWLRVLNHDKANYDCSEAILEHDLRKIVVEYHRGDDHG